MLVKAETETNMDLAEIETRLVKTLTEFPTPSIPLGRKCVSFQGFSDFMAT